MSAKAHTAEVADQDQSKWFWAGLALGAIACGALVFFLFKTLGQDDAQPQTKPSAPLVKTTAVRFHGQSYAVTGNGFLEPADTVDIVAEVAGKIAYANPELVPGASIDEGSVLVRLDQRSFQARLSKAKANVSMAAANLQQAQADFKRKSELLNIGGVPEAQVELAAAQLATRKAQLAQAEADLEIAKDDMAKTVLRAPFDAIVDSESASVGDFVSPNASIASLLDRNTAEVIVGLPREDAQAVLRARRLGGDVTVHVSPNGLDTAGLMGDLVEIQRALDRQARTVLATVRVKKPFAGKDGDAFFYGTYVDVRFKGALAAKPLYAFDNGAINGSDTVWRLSPKQTLQKVTVNPVKVMNDRLLAAGPLGAGDQLVMTGMPEAAQGMKVRVAQPSQKDRGAQSEIAMTAAQSAQPAP